jgi:hypothetical protein
MAQYRHDGYGRRIGDVFVTRIMAGTLTGFLFMV